MVDKNETAPICAVLGIAQQLDYLWFKNVERKMN